MTDMFWVEARDSGDEQWKRSEKPFIAREARSRMISMAALMLGTGWKAIGMNRNSITVMNPDDVARKTQFRMRKAAQHGQ